jgi:hypothetical protein
MAVDSVFFVRGDAVLTFDVTNNKTAGDQQTVGALWTGVPPEFETGLKAALDLGTFLLFVFSGDEYLRIPFATQAVDDGYPKPISGNWSGVTFDHIDAAMNWGDGKVYLFSGSQYARYDITNDEQDAGYPKPIAGNWKGVDAAWVGDGIDAAVNLGTGSAYLFKGGEYIRIDWYTKTQDAGPTPIDAGWPGLGNDQLQAAWTNAPGMPPPKPSPGAASFFQSYGSFADQSQSETGVPALVTLGQAALESGWGEHAPGNNFFGIKAKATDPEESRQLLKTREVLSTPDAVFPEVISVTPRPDGKFEYLVRDWFRAYPTPAESFSDHGRFLRDNSRYAAAFDHTDDPYAFAQAVADAGYATDPSYATVLAGRMRLIEASE